MLINEPIILRLAVYSSFVNGLSYILFEAFPIEFLENRGWTPVQGSLPFLSVLFSSDPDGEKSTVISIFGTGSISSTFILIFQNAVNYLIYTFTVHAAKCR
ncbi:hypothetical protein BKA65DRAFT_477497 [Rhexocercosporidium sp. MPI-PUGE-AT-0058]|nr:hypothetical protein BKA65DRAFT_477497 [Rhexocercosporidium sp. MPI-PUGE-AT-0058]